MKYIQDFITLCNIMSYVIYYFLCFFIFFIYHRRPVYSEGKHWIRAVRL